MKSTYTIVKECNGDKIIIDYSKLDGYKFKPKNKIKYNGIKVNSIVVVKKSFIEKLLKKKVKRKLNYYLEYIISLIDNDDEDGSGLKEALTDLERYKSIVEYKYKKYLNQKYITLLLKKIKLLENELKTKILIYENEEVLVEENKKSR